MDFYERFREAELLFAVRDYRTAASRLERLLADLAEGAEGTSEGPGEVLHGVSGARELLARAYYHSAQLGRAEAAARELLAGDPTDAYAALLLARTLQRQSRPDEADRVYRRAAALGAPGVSRGDQRSAA